MTHGPLHGIVVLDLGWLMVAPVSARMLAEMGATVIKIESPERADPLRGLGASKAAFHLMNAGKLGLSLDLQSEKGRDVLTQLIKRADILIESFTPGVIDRLGFGPDRVHDLKPAMVMVSTGILGRTGPLGKGMSGTGTTGSAYSGASGLVGMPDRHPDGPAGPWTDAVAPRFLVPAILAALDRARRTGVGEHIDLAQAEAGLQFLLPAYLDHAVNGTVSGPSGAVIDPLRCPCASYPCAGDDRWITIDASDPASYAALAGMVGGSLAGPKMSRLVARLRARSEIDAAISAWTADRDAQQLEAMLQEAGVPAHVVAQDADLSGPGDLRDAGHFVALDDVAIGRFELPLPQYSLGRTRLAPRTPGPEIGQSSALVLESLLGMDGPGIQALAGDGVIAQPTGRSARTEPR